ncbi:MAG: hypothetical protein KAR20_23940, partial [Candidatus Heimdallarchaeota archaeon]|nr:hypothetical protein [Candidatus Heimdallarchaeota archaeon]
MEREKVDEEVNSTFDFDIALALPFDMFHVKYIAVNLLSTEIHVEGDVDLRKQLINARVYSQRCIVADMPFFSLLVGKSLVRANAKIEGPVGFDLVVEGDYHRQQVKGFVTFDEAELCYGERLKKQAEFGLVVEGAFSIEEFRTISGIVNINFGDLILKGDIVGFDIQTLEGEVTFLTNKFDINSLAQHVSVLEEYSMEGRAKVLCNAKGKFSDIRNIDFSGNITLEKIGCEKDEIRIDSLQTIITINQECVEVGSFECSIFDSQINGWIQVADWMSVPSLSFDLYAEEFCFDDILTKIMFSPQGSVVAFSPDNEMTKQEKIGNVKERKNAFLVFLETLRSDGSWYIGKALFNNTEFNELKGIVSIDKRKIIVDTLSCNGFGGNISVAGNIDRNSSPVLYDGKIEINQLEIKKLLL